MDPSVEFIFHEAIKLEKTIGKLYSFFEKLFPEDSQFWNKLSKEEEKHAQILKEEHDIFLIQKLVPEGLTEPNWTKNLEQIGEIENFIENSEKESPSKNDAYEFALKIEKEAGELHFQRTAVTNKEGEDTNIFKMLVQEDKNHALRIEKFIQETL